MDLFPWEEFTLPYFLVGLFGIFGAMARYGIGILFSPISIFPYGTLCINWFGCFLLSWLTKSAFQRLTWASEVKTAIGTGFVGSFTTFSTFSVETVKLVRDGNPLLGLLYILASLTGGFFMAYLGAHAKKEENHEPY